MMINLIGKRFERLIVIKRMDNDKWRNLYWLCKCDCGNKTIILGGSLRAGRTKSCGCLQKEKLINRLTKHGHTTKTTMSRIYRIWALMIQRCTNVQNKDYHYYGGREITVCKRWRQFPNFLKDMYKPPTNKHTLDRINNDGDYCKSNCRWSTRKQQQRNRRDNHLETYNGKTQCVITWAEELGINKSTLRMRLQRGWLIEKAMTTPVRKWRKQK